MRGAVEFNFLLLVKTIFTTLMQKRDYLYRRIIIGLILLMAYGSFSAFAATHTVYFVDYDRFGPDNTLVHVWHDDYDDDGNRITTDFKHWLDNDHMEAVGTYVKVEEQVGEQVVHRYYPVYAYTFEWDLEPSGLIFRDNAQQTCDLAYREGGYYKFVKKADSTDPTGCDLDISDFTFVNKEEVRVHTLYYVDVNEYPAGKSPTILVHTWGNNGDYSKWEHNPAMELTEYYYKQSSGNSNTDVWGRVYKIDLLDGRDFTDVIFRYTLDGQNVATNTLDFHDDGVYTNINGTDSGYLKEYQKEDFYTLEDERCPHTLYFVDDRGWGAENTRVHIWGKFGNYRGDWQNNPHMEPTGKYVNLDGKWRPVYALNFNYPGELYQLIIHPNDTENTGILDFEEGGYYTFRASADEGVLLSSEIEIVDEADLPKQTIYFADTEAWGVENTKIHIWGATGDYKPWYENDGVTSTGKYVKVNDVWAEVYKFEFVNVQEFDHALFHNIQYGMHQTADLTLEDGRVYYYCGKGWDGKSIECDRPIVTVADMVDAIPDEKMSKTFYINLGANQIFEQAWKEPHAIAIRRDKNFTTYGDYLPELDSEEYVASKMEQVRPGFYKITIDDIHDCNDIVFFYGVYNKDGEWTYKDRDFPASRSPNFEPTKWATFIYDIGIDCAHMSYLTSENYKKQWDEKPAELFMVGNAYLDEDFSPEGLTEEEHLQALVMVGLDKYQSMESDDDVFIHKFKVPDASMEGADDVANYVQFKLSRFNIFKEAAKYDISIDNNRFDSQRGWATFNIGVIGADPGCEIPSDEYYWWRSEYVHESEIKGESRQVKIKLNNSVNFNNYTQYGWRLSANSKEAGALPGPGEYYLVIDYHEDDHSITLLEFNPNPKITVEDTSLEIRDVDYDFTAGLDNNETHYGAQANGKVGINKVNVLSAVTTVQGQTKEYLDEHNFTVEYTLTVDGNVAGYADEAGDNITIPYMTPGAEHQTGVRARYTDKDTQRSFCSRISHDVVKSPDPAILAPAVYEVTGEWVNYDVEDENGKRLVMSAAATIPYTFGAKAAGGSLAYYPDYSVKSVTLNGEEVNSPVSIIHYGHLANDHYNDYLGSNSASDDHENVWTPYVDGGEYGPQHNWADYVANEGQLPLFFEELTSLKVGEHSLKGESTIELHAVYPFLTLAAQGVSQDTPAEVRSCRAGEANDEPSDGDDTGEGESGEVESGEGEGSAPEIPLQLYSLRATSAPVKVTLNEKVVSGVESVAVDVQPEGTPMYHTISGVLLSGRPQTPGIYLQTLGDKTTKVVIR